MVIGLLLSPIPIAALIIMLMTAQARNNGMAFIAGWLLGVFGVGLIVISFPGLGTGDSTPLPYAQQIRLIIGLILIFWSSFNIIRRYRTPNPEIPRFFQNLDHIKASRAFGVGLLVSAGNIKNLGFSAAAAVIINQAQTDYLQSLLYLTSYSLIGSTTVLIPAGLYFMLHHKADPILQHWKAWLMKNHAYILSGVVIFVGLMIIKGGQ